MTVSPTQVGETVGAGDRRESLRDLLIVDCDVHVHECPRALIPFAEPKWRTSLETIADIPERYLDIPAFSGGGILPVAPLSRVATRRADRPDRGVDEARARCDRRRHRDPLPATTC